MKPLFHRHKWENKTAAQGILVRVCLCGAIQTRLVDVNTYASIWVNGVVAHKLRLVIAIVAGNIREFQEAKRKILASTTLDDTTIVFLTSNVIDKLHGVTVYLYGTWWENPDYQTEDMTNKINKLIYQD